MTPEYMRNIAFLLPILTAISPLGRATVVYSFATSTNSIHFQYTSPGFITTTTVVPVGNLDSCVFLPGGSCGEVDFFPAFSSNDVVQISNPSHSSTNHYNFALGTFSSSPFSGNDVDNFGGTLTIPGRPTAAPEPATWTMVAAALLVCFVRRARRQNRTQ